MSSDGFSAESYLQHNSGFDEAEVLDVFEGHNNLNFVFTSNRGKFVLRKRNQISDDEDVLLHEKKILEFLEYKDIDSTPNSIEYDSANQVHIISYTGKEKINVEELDKKDLRQWVKKLCKVHELEFSDFKEFCEANNCSYQRPETPQEKLYRMTEMLDSIEDEVNNTDLLEFCEDKIEELRGYDSVDESRKFHLMHSDLSNSTRKTDEDFYFIDWEYASFGFNPISDIAILFVHRDLNESQKTVIKESYRENMAVSELKKNLQKAKNTRVIFDILWALKRTLKSPENSEKHNHIDFALKQKEKYEEL